jgi:hypothetical protein
LRGVAEFAAGCGGGVFAGEASFHEGVDFFVKVLANQLGKFFSSMAAGEELAECLHRRGVS